MPKQQPEPLPLQRSLAQEPLQVVFQFQETEPTPVLQPTPLQEPVADLGFLNGGQVPKARGSRRHRRRGGIGIGRGCAPPQKFLILKFNSTQLNSTGHVTLTAKRDQKKGKKANSLSISLISNIVIHTPFKAVYSVAVNSMLC